jgi:hypothetical protein
MGKQARHCNAQSPILRTAITEKRLRRRGFESLLEYYLKVKF